MEPPTTPYANALLTDFYQLTMIASYFKIGMHRRRVVFEYFYRDAPFHGLYSVFVGLHALIEYLQNLRFTDEQISYLRAQNVFDDEFLVHLREFRFTGTLESMREGEVLLPGVYGIRVLAALEEAQLIETALLTLVNFPTLIATKASHVKFNAEDKNVMEFGLRRAQGVDGAMTASRAAYIGGTDATSNVAAGFHYGIPVAGTHAHSYVMFFSDEVEAFEHYAYSFPKAALFLVDTYDIYKGLLNAIRVAQAMQQMGQQASGVRIDSGDLTYWSIVAHVMLEHAGLPEMRIVLSNDLNERKIALLHNEIRRSVRDEGYRREISLEVGYDVPQINADEVVERLIFGVGTQLITGGDQSSLGGVYKLVAVENTLGEWEPRIKISAQPEKVTNPGLKKTVRLLRNGFIVADIVALDDEVIEPGRRFVGVNPNNPSQQTTYEHYDAVEALHIPIFVDGKLVYEMPPIKEVRAYAKSRIRTIRLESRRLENPHTLKVSLTEHYWKFKQEIAEQARQAEEMS
ncbi:MAG: nicotinate phosphoribosyltransferase [Anaerolineae bacterium]|nr:nicotinate phosphoribosyltransferase [Anaerolineae bacterium]